MNSAKRFKPRKYRLSKKISKQQQQSKRESHNVVDAQAALPLP